MAKFQTQLPEEYGQDKQKETLDDMNKSLRELQQDLIKKSMQCHELQVDLATQFNPRTVKAVLEAKKECQKCCEQLAPQKKDTSSTDQQH